MRYPIDRTGQRYGRLVVTAPAAPAIEPSGRSRAKWSCLCDCGHRCDVRGSDLHSGRTRSCGCLFAEKSPYFTRTHGETADHRPTPEYRAWAGMIKRCENSHDGAFIHYGGRGITVCDRWRDSFENFLADMGRRPSSRHSIDRRDNDGNYEPDNCRWATKRQQSVNKRGTLVVTVNGADVPLIEECERRGLRYESIVQRMRRYGWNPQQALDAPLKKRHSHERKSYR